MLATLRRWAVAAVLAAIALLYVLLQLARSGLRDARQDASEQRERADASEALRDLERDVQAARGVVREQAREVEQEAQRREADDDRPAVFGDPRLHARTKDRL